MRGLPPQRPSLNGGNRITESAPSMHGFMAFFVAFEGRCVWNAGCQQGQEDGRAERVNSMGRREDSGLEWRFLDFSVYFITEVFFFFLVFR